MLQNSRFNANGQAINYVGGPCPLCAVVAQFAIRAQWQEVITGVLHFYLVAACNNCDGRLFVKAKGHASSGVILEVYPFPKLTLNLQSVPTHVAGAANEAQQCVHIGSWTAAVIMCRRAIQSSVKQLGAADDKLYKQIDDLCAAGKIASDIKDWAHEIRHFGNAGAHPDDLFGDVTEADAIQTLEFLKSYLMYVYDLPGRVKESRSRRGAATPTP